MSEDLTKRLSVNDKDEILTAVRNLESYVRSSIDNIQTWVGSIDIRFERLETRLGSLEQTVDARLHDTRPIWHKVVADIAELRAGIQRLEERLEKGQEELRAQIRDLSSTVRDVNRDQIVINDVARRIQLDFHAIDERLHQLELNRN